MPINNDRSDIFAAGYQIAVDLDRAKTAITTAEERRSQKDLNDAFAYLKNAQHNLNWCYLHAGLHKDDCATLEDAAATFRHLFRQSNELEIEDEDPKTGSL